MGFNWLKNENNQEGYVYNTEATKALSNRGHDKDIKMDAVNYRLNWDNDEASARAIIEYMKVL